MRFQCVSLGGSSLPSGGSSQNPENHVKMVVSPGGAFLITGQFLGRTQNLRKTCELKGDSNIHDMETFKTI